MLLTLCYVILIIISFPSPHTLSFLKSFSFSSNPFHFSLFFSSSGLTAWIPLTVTVASEHIRFFYFLVFFLFYTFLVVGSVR